VIGSNAASFAYDYQNRLLAAAFGSSYLQYAYDGLGRRLSSTQNNLQTLYVLDPNGALPNVIAETDSSGNIQDYYIYGQGLLYKLLPNGSTYSYHFDSRGSSIAMTDNFDNMVNLPDYKTKIEKFSLGLLLLFWNLLFLGSSRFTARFGPGAAQSQLLFNLFFLLSLTLEVAANFEMRLQQKR